MRIIKFRGKDQAGIWHYGDLLHGENAIFIDNTYSEVLGLISPTKVLPETVGQFTGLLDKNGNEIYEGDIIHIKGNTVDKDFGVVTFHKYGYFYIDDGFGEFPRDCCKPIGDFLDDISRDDVFQGMKFYVNSNIHDNKRK